MPGFSFNLRLLTVITSAYTTTRKLSGAQNFSDVSGKPVAVIHGYRYLGFQALAPEKVRLADNDGLMPRDESEGVFPEKVPFRERFLLYSTCFQLFENI
jgi:hypothetical protein